MATERCSEMVRYGTLFHIRRRVAFVLHIFISPSGSKKNNKSQKQNNKKPTVTEQRT